MEDFYNYYDGEKESYENGSLPEKLSMPYLIGEGKKKSSELLENWKGNMESMMKNMKFPLTQSQMRNRFSAISGIVLKQIME